MFSGNLSIIETDKYEENLNTIESIQSSTRHCLIVKCWMLNKLFIKFAYDKVTKKPTKKLKLKLEIFHELQCLTFEKCTRSHFRMSRNLPFLALLSYSNVSICISSSSSFPSIQKQTTKNVKYQRALIRKKSKY